MSLDHDELNKRRQDREKRRKRRQRAMYIKLVLLLQEPAAPSILMEKLEKLFLFREHYWGKNFATSPETYCGYGPYQITSSNSQEIILEPNPNWWGTAVTEDFDRIICRAAGKD